MSIESYVKHWSGMERVLEAAESLDIPPIGLTKEQEERHKEYWVFDEGIWTNKKRGS